MNPIEKVTSALRRLQLSDNEQAVYLSLLTEGATSARTLASRTGITRPSVYDQLKSLRQHGLVHELEIEGKAQFAAADLKHLEALLDDQIDRLEQSRVFLQESLPSLTNSLQTVNPKLRFFEGAEGIKQLLKDIMWHDHETMQIIWAASSMEEVYADTFLTWFDERRAKRTLAIQSLWPADHTAPDRFTMLPDDDSRTLPDNTAPAMTSILYGTKVACISSSAEAFGFIVESAEFNQLQKLQFDRLWQQAM